MTAKTTAATKAATPAKAPAKRGVPKPNSPEYKPGAGICRHRSESKLYDCSNAVRPADGKRKESVWCEKHILAHAAAAKAARPAKAPRAKAAAKATTTKRVPKNSGGQKRVSKSPEKPAFPAPAAVARVIPAPEQGGAFVQLVGPKG